MTQARPSAQQVVDGYEVLFDPLTRAAHRACLEHARLTREGGWPTVETCLTLAKLFGVAGADVAAFFGWLGYREGGRTVWVDALHGPISSWTARNMATHSQKVAFGYTCCALATREPESVH